MRGGNLTLIVLVAALVAGCVTPSPETKTATVPQQAGDGPYTLRIHVTDEPGGPPLAGALVEVTSRSTGVFGSEGTQTVMITTDAQGTAIAHVADSGEGTVRISLDGHTTETKRHIDLGVSGGDDIIVPLYLSRVTMDITDTLGPGDASTHRTGVGNFHWQPHELKFGRNEEARRGYAARIVLLNFTLAWQNTPTAMGDLGIAAGKSQDSANVVQDANAYQLPPGAYEEKMSLTLSDMRHAGWERAHTLYAGAGTGTGYASPTGLPYTMKVDAVFDGNQALRESPGFNQVWGALAALAGVALLVRRR